MSRIVCALVVAFTLGALAYSQGVGQQGDQEELTERLTQFREIRQPEGQPHDKSADATKWEYKVVQYGGPMQEHELNALGAERWELVIAAPYTSDAAAWVFKRTK